MQIKTLASGSKGNAYLVYDGTTMLLLECGISIREIMKRSNYSLSRVDACLVTHEHGDHAKAAQDILFRGIPLYCSAGTAASLNITNCPGCRAELRHLQETKVDTMLIQPLSVYHDAEEPLGWMIESKKDGTRLVFLTDTSHVDYIFPPVDHIMIECNHMGASSMSDCNAYLARRVLDNHLSMDACIQFLRAQEMSQVKDIRLLHISHRHGDPSVMRHAAAAATGKFIIIAEEEATCRI